MVDSHIFWHAADRFVSPFWNWNKADRPLVIQIGGNNAEHMLFTA